MHLFKMRMLTLFRSKVVIFWSLIFPIILATFYSLAFKNVLSGEIIKTIDIVVVDNEYLTDDFLNTISNVEISDGKKMFNVVLKDSEGALSLLKDDEVVGIIELNSEKIAYKVNQGGLYQTITKSFLDEYIQTTAAVMDLIVLSENNQNDIINDLMNNKNYIDEVSSTRNKANVILIMYFSLIGMALIYGGFWGTDNIINLQANMTPKGVRIAVSPVNRLKILLIYTLCAFIIHILIIFILLFYITVILGVDFGGKLLYVIIVCILGSLVGITFGSFISIALKKVSEGIKITITTFVGIIGGFLSGMMVVDMKYIIQTKAPFIQYINPISVITDALHTLNYFGVTSRYYLNIGILGIMVIVFTIGTYMFYRRDSYESI